MRVPTELITSTCSLTLIKVHGSEQENTVEPLYSKHPRGAASSDCVLIKGGILISGVLLYTSLLHIVAGTTGGVLIKVDVLISGVSL